MILNVRQAADLLQMHPESLRRLLRDQPELGIPHKRIGTGKRPRYRFLSQQLEDWIGRGAHLASKVPGKNQERKTG